MKLENLIIAHRGIHNNKDIPENSIKAFKEALNKGYPIELDVRLTKDNVLVVFHDYNLKRMTNSSKNIDELTYNELKKLKLLNSNEIIPTLHDVLCIINGKVLLNIEIKSKNNKICPILLNELKNYNQNFIIQSFNPKIIRWFYKHNPNIIRGLLIDKKYYNGIIGKLIFYYSKPNFLSISKKYIDNFKNSKYPIMIWTIKNKHEMYKYKQVANNYICDISR